MTWETLISNWNAAQAMARFPWLEEDAMRFVHQDQEKFAQHLAASHDLTLAEAMDEIENWLLTQTVALQRRAA